MNPAIEGNRQALAKLVTGLSIPNAWHPGQRFIQTLAILNLRA